MRLLRQFQGELRTSPVQRRSTIAETGKRKAGSRSWEGEVQRATGLTMSVS